MSGVCRWKGELPAADLREVLRYAACRQENEQVLALARACAAEGEGVLRPALCWRRVKIGVSDDGVELPFGRIESRKLAAALSGCDEAVVFAATVGLELDRLIARYGRLSPSRGLLMQAFGAERVEALCDAFCAWLAEECAPLVPRQRFSPGYGDWLLEGQRMLFAALDCHKQIGLYLNESLLMSPTKSVTAIVGLGREGKCGQSGCGSCEKTDCVLRREEL